ncbi:hypothetical protein K438DRAFT_591645 [Mycena galopus ATCC 62051]|nr:hypothetical protein K438DRAFT_591645 [Mycena galopus ATCC 62051]
MLTYDFSSGTPILPLHAAFPHGVPDPGASTSSNSDSDPGGVSAIKAESSGCNCKLLGDGECHCCTPRTRPGVGARRRSEPPPPTSLGALTNSNSSSPTLTLPSSSGLASTSIINTHPNLNLKPHCGNPNTNLSPTLPATPHPTPNPSPNPNSPNTTLNAPHTLPANGPSNGPRAPSQSHHILARLAELRPVLPRLSARDAALMGMSMQGVAGQHDLFHHSPGHHGQPHQGCHSHPEHFSPYGRAYEHALGMDYSSDASTSSAGFYQQDARSVESLLSVGSLASVASHRSAPAHPHPHRNSSGQSQSQSQKSKSQKSHSQKSHSQKSPSYDGNPNNNTFFPGTLPKVEVEWRLPPSLSRSSGDANPSSTPTPNPTHSPLYDDAVFAPPRPRSEGGGRDVYSLPSVSDAVYAPRPRSEGGGVLSGGGVRTCGCGAGCACAGCALHGVSLSGGASSSNAIDAGNNGGRRCADPAQCGGACLDCTILTLPDFSAGFGGGGDKYQLDAGSGNGNGDGKLVFDGSAADDALAYRTNTKAYSVDFGDLDVDGYTRDLGDLELEGYEQLDLDLAPDSGYDLGPDIDMEMDERQSAAIDEWIREVGGSLPPAPAPTPFEFDGMGMGPGMEGFDGAGTTTNANSSSRTAAKLEFEGLEFDVGQSWMFDVGVSGDGGADAQDGADVRMPAPVSGPMQGLTSADMRPATTFLSVPGPVAGVHGRSRSSSSASSSEAGAEVSMLGVSAGTGVNIPAAARDVGLSVGAGLGAVPALDPHPLHGRAALEHRQQPLPFPPQPPMPTAYPAYDMHMDELFLSSLVPSPLTHRPHI